ncbi:Uncharacterised protein [Mycobacteroides abscessus subsp. abscessus]|nr:Uncharacterised protein [Mycobacteroides abscessus subsp. abscessus]
MAAIQHTPPGLLIPLELVVIVRLPHGGIPGADDDLNGHPGMPVLWMQHGRQCVRAVYAQCPGDIAHECRPEVNVLHRRPLGKGETCAPTSFIHRQLEQDVRDDRSHGSEHVEQRADLAQRQCQVLGCRIAEP